MAAWAPLDGAQVLVAGCGIGAYAGQIQRRYSSQVQAFDIEFGRVQQARAELPQALVAAGETMPFAANSFDALISHEVIEHVADDQKSAREMLRVIRPGGRILLFCPNRWYPFETHGHYWRGAYHFGNSPFVNYLPKPWRDRLAPHVRAYTAAEIRTLLDFDRARILHHGRIYGGYDNIIARLGAPAVWLRDLLYRLEGSRLDTWGLSHFLVVEKRP